MTLEEFLQPDQPYKNQWVKHPEFKSLYVRKGKSYGNAIQIASIEARKPGKGAFTRLIAWLRENYPDRPIFLENILNERFEAHLMKVGFVPADFPTCYLLEKVQ